MDSLREVVNEHLPGLRALSEEQAGHKPGPEVWSARQILGHLIDSGVNNHARFVRAGAEDGLSLPGYDQNAWVAAGGYQERCWAEVLTLWAAYQTGLAHVIEGLTPEQRTHTLSIGGGEAVTLDFVATDYVRHQLHHLAQIPGRTGAGAGEGVSGPPVFDRPSVERVRAWLLTLDGDAVGRVPGEGVWSARQVLGHLIDSAANNHARWARMAGQDDLTFPTWDQDGWNAAQDWQGEGWPEVVALWTAYNRHLARFQALLTPEALGHRARIGTLNGGQPMTLAELLTHYARHWHHHLNQIRERAAP